MDSLELENTVINNLKKESLNIVNQKLDNEKKTSQKLYDFIVESEKNHEITVDKIVEYLQNTIDKCNTPQDILYAEVFLNAIYYCYHDKYQSIEKINNSFYYKTFRIIEKIKMFLDTSYDNEDILKAFYKYKKDKKKGGFICTWQYFEDTMVAHMISIVKSEDEKKSLNEWLEYLYHMDAIARITSDK